MKSKLFFTNQYKTIAKRTKDFLNSHEDFISQAPLTAQGPWETPLKEFWESTFRISLERIVPNTQRTLHEGRWLTWPSKISRISTMSLM